MTGNMQDAKEGESGDGESNGTLANSRVSGYHALNEDVNKMVASANVTAV